MADGWGRAARYPLFVSVYNWCRALRGIAFYLVFVWTYPLMDARSESFLQGGVLFQWSLFFFLCGLLVYQWFVAKVGLSVRGGRALMIVFLEALVEFCASIVFHGFFHGVAGSTGEG